MGFIFNRYFLVSLAQIRQWDMLFYGTETPAQPEDPPRFGKPGLSENIYGSEIDHNSLEFEGERASGQWRDTHQVSNITLNNIFIYNLNVTTAAHH